MTPQFAQAVDPIFLVMLDLLEQIGNGRSVSPQNERYRISAAIDSAEATLGGGHEWELAKYGLISWIDEMLVETPWVGREWWSNNVLEVQHFNTRLCNERFYTKAQESAAQPRRDALEVFYNCVILGFRGLYRDANLASELTAAHGLPPDLLSWTKQTSMAIRLGQGRPPLPRPRRELKGVPPLGQPAAVVWLCAIASMLFLVDIGYFLYIQLQ
jgi:type VI secretion system protein ImpK